MKAYRISGFLLATAVFVFLHAFSSDKSVMDQQSLPQIVKLDEDEDYHFDDENEDLDVAHAPSDIRGRRIDVLKQLLERLGDAGPFPVVVGGIGDSGTRGVREVLRDFGVQMLGDHFVNKQGDSHLFEKHMVVYDPKSDSFADRSARILYKLGLHRARTVQYNQSFFSEKSWEWGRQFIGSVLTRSMNASAQFRASRGRPLGLWGFKHPRTVLVLPFLISAMGNKMRFVHVLRDPKEVVMGDNQQMFVGECRRYYGREKCSRSYEKKSEFWADVNMDVLSLARKHLTDESYMVVRTEDFVDGKEDCFRRLAKFVGVTPATIEERLNRSMSTSIEHRLSYFGSKVPVDTKKYVVTALEQAPQRVRDAVDLFGYSTEHFALTTDCTKIPRIGS